ncbi:MAG: Metal-dependent hydrolases of the beta-lactamase superfamily III [uncultured Nocardioidaceae bacterium]|uniref:Metal-dependent hydrolases of the beta-lactamase superfamily III n=1 Tax=uncultured Nocardioidaceae bacterium TaxID=253824 RepID=A0A6J4LF17_9ACTN|nr:MAG: Metal-dependent hydrolases of the beta-lactamase superfamily III [uncultured Nocardioidaceae bacterium]
MRLTVIGCSGSFPGPESAASSYLVEAPYEGRTYRLLLDLGSGALGALQRHCDPRDLDAVVLSHLHADHCLDLCGLHVLLRYHPEGHGRRIPVWGPDGTADRLARAYDLPVDPGMHDEFEFAAFPATTMQLGPLEVDVTPVVHPVEAYAIRVRAEGRTLVYSGDTGPCAGLVDFARDADLLLAEASFVESADNPADLHLTGRQAAEHAVAADVGRLVLTHVPPWTAPDEVLADAATVAKMPFELARPGASYDL